MDVMQAILSRRSIRKYKSQPISDQDIQDLLEAAVYAPSGINMQPWYFLVIRSEEAMARLKVMMEKTFDKFLPTLQKRFSRNPEVIEQTKPFLTNLGGAPICVLVFLLKSPEQDTQYEDTLTVSQSVSAAIENMLLAACGKGLGSCWMTAPTNAGLGEEIRQEFAPERGQLMAAVTLGYPDESPNAPKRREGRFDII